MTYGKKNCKILKEIRQQIADRNNIEYITSECHFQGECKGTCPKCEAELQYLENELSKRRQLGKAVAVAGISLGIASTFSACNAPQQQTDMPTSEQKIAAEMTNIDTTSLDTIPAILPCDKVSKLPFSPGTMGTVPEIIDIVPDIIDTVPPPLAGVVFTEKDDLYEILSEDLFNLQKEIEKEKREQDSIYEFPEILPCFPGGDKELQKFLVENIKYPPTGVSGTVYVRFVVERNGTISNIIVVKSPANILSNEVARVVKAMPKWIPGKQNGKIVRAYFTLPINFQLD